MKNKLFKRVMALTVVASMSVIGNINIVKADKITSLPYVNNFDGNADERHTASFYADNGNKLGVWQWYNPTGNDVLELTTDAAAPERGKVMKLSMNSVNDCFLKYDLGTQSTGKLLIKFDMKAQNQYNVNFVMKNVGETTYWRCLRLAANSAILNEYDANPVNATYTFNEYNTVKILVDFDNDKVTTCFKDKMGVTTLPHDSIPGFQIQYVASGATSRSDVLYIDNMEIRKVSGMATPVLTDAEGTQIGAFSSVTDTINLSLADGDSLENIPEAKLIDLGATPVAVTEREIAIADSELINGQVTYYLDEELTAGNRYKLVIDDVTSAWAQKLSKTEFEFVCSETNGKIVTTYEEDFSKATEINAYVGGESVYGESEMIYFYVGNGGGVTLDTNSNYKGGKALKLAANTQIGYRFANSNNGLKHGEIELEAHIIPTGWGQLKIGNDSVANHRFFQWGGVYFLNYFQAPDGVSTYSRSSDYLHNGDIVVKHKLNLDDKTYDVNVNGTDYDYDGKKYDINLVDSTDAGNWLDKGAAFVKFMADGEQVLDYFTFKHSVDAPTVTKITFVDDNDNELQYVEGTKLSGGKAMKVYFNEAVNESKLEAITVKKGDTAVAYQGSYDSDNNVYTLTFDGGLDEGTSYNVSIPAGTVVSSANGTGSREVIEGTVVTDGVAAAASVKITDAEGGVIEDIADAGNTINIVAENVKSDDNKVVIVYAGYNGGRLVEMSFDEVDVVSGSAEYEAIIKDKSALTSIKAFVLEDLATVEPLCRCKEI